MAIALFLLTVVTTLIAGSSFYVSYDELITNPGLIATGIPFACSLLSILLAHEMGDYKKKHIIKTLLIGIIQMGVVSYLLSLFIDNQALFEAFYIEKKSIYAGLIFFGLLYSPIDFFTGIFMQFYSRKNGYEADRFAVETTNDKTSLSDALKKLTIGNLSNLTPHPFCHGAE